MPAKAKRTGKAKGRGAIGATRSRGCRPRFGPRRAACPSQSIKEQDVLRHIVGGLGSCCPFIPVPLGRPEWARKPVTKVAPEAHARSRVVGSTSCFTQSMDTTEAHTNDAVNEIKRKGFIEKNRNYPLPYSSSAKHVTC